ncbi:hypothetical protein CY35_16G063300 [Sphagnum magellanicum]|nr:hypothetical protein CY35_16G063300 [Sphagnum magellanicum]
MHKALTSTREVQLRKYRIDDILKTQKTPSILKNGTVFSMSRNELPKDETLVEAWGLHPDLGG